MDYITLINKISEALDLYRKPVVGCLTKEGIDSLCKECELKPVGDVICQNHMEFKVLPVDDMEWHDEEHSFSIFEEALEYYQGLKLHFSKVKFPVSKEIAYECTLEYEPAGATILMNGIPEGDLPKAVKWIQDNWQAFARSCEN